MSGKEVGIALGAILGAHAPRGFFPLLNAGELAIIYCFVFLYLAVAGGGGVWSLDHLRTGNETSRAAWRPSGGPLVLRLASRHT
jgi:putative oxidoreductase